MRQQNQQTFEPAEEGAKPEEPPYFEALRRSKGDDLQRAFAELWEDKAGLVTGWLRNKYRSLPTDYIDSAVADGFIQVWRILETGGRWEETPMASLSGIFEIAHRRAIDCYRAITRRGKVSPPVLHPNDAALSLAFAATSTDDPNDKRSDEHNERQRFEFLSHQIRAAIVAMPVQQQRVAEIMVENYEDDRLTYEEIQELYHTKFTEEIPFASVKSAKREILEKLAPIYEPYRRRHTTLWHRISPRKTPTT